jgi:hypothetical protein
MSGAEARELERRRILAKIKRMLDGRGLREHGHVRGWQRLDRYTPREILYELRDWLMEKPRRRKP